MKRIINTISIQGIIIIIIFNMGCTKDVPLRSLYTLQFKLSRNTSNPFTEIDLSAVFVKPEGDSAVVKGFYDGDGIFKIRAYCSETGEWKWSTSSNAGKLNNRRGRFTVVPSELRGKLRINTSDPYQFMYDNGEWFLHIGETGYRYLVDTENFWQEYIDQAAVMGATKFRCWFARSRRTVEALYNEDRSGLNLDYWQEMEKRLNYALENHPEIVFQLIPFAEDDQELLSFLNGDPISHKAIEYMQARWSAYPNVYYCISNDRDIKGREDLREAVKIIGNWMKKQEPWGTLITNHQKRYQGYAFVEDRWSDIITLEDIDQVDGRKVLEYRTYGRDPVVLDEDRYENWRSPSHDRYYYRRLMWANLFSGGHPTYGGLRTYEAYTDTLTPCGIIGYYRANELGLLEDGAHDFVYIHKFFRDKNINLVNWIPSDSLTGNIPAIYKCMRKENEYLLYLQNPDDPVNHGTANVSEEVPEVTLDLDEGLYSLEWYCPLSGLWSDTDTIKGSKQVRLIAPGGKDWIVLVSMIE